ncbi:AraC family transcriptional regulator [Paenibacillus massiliensis]|uniref:AraC family transcriptional regulator n=1 Tax=Paenibacillus massiliensis TaxID=225917 RepID=UPI00299DB544|nr:AraC family transcriptional regulator [Paenibacillus massiliensis]
MFSIAVHAVNEDTRFQAKFAQIQGGEGFVIIPKEYRSYLSSDARWLPATDWNVKLFGAHMQTVQTGWRVPLESHLAFEIVLILAGAQSTRLEHVQYELQEGDILLIPPGVKHTNECRAEQGLTYFIAHFNVDDALFRQEMSQHAQLLFERDTEHNMQLREQLMKWVGLLQQEEDYTTAALFRSQAILFEILSILAEKSSSRLQEAVPPLAARYAAQIAEAIKSCFSHENMKKGGLSNQGVRIEDIASSLNISSGYALEIFQKVYGISPRQYLSELKLHEAKQLIHQPDLSLSDIAALLGYSSLAHFSRQFKRWAGISPSEYRRTLGDIRFF